MDKVKRNYTLILATIGMTLGSLWLSVMGMKLWVDGVTVNRPFTWGTFILSGIIGVITYLSIHVNYPNNKIVKGVFITFAVALAAYLTFICFSTDILSQLPKAI